jgi:DNA-binding NtrC family response regulator
VLGPASRIQEALDLLKAETAEAALLDVNVAGQMSFQVAEVLAARGVPFAFVTGYAGEHPCPEHLQDRPVVAKPFNSSSLTLLVDRLIAERARG